MSWTTVDGWNGRVWVSVSGKRTFYIRQMRDGKHWDVSTKCSTMRAAQKELERFEQDPTSYRPLGAGAQLVLNDDLIDTYAKWCLEHTEATDPRWLEAKKRYLRWWKDQLDYRALPSVKLSLILAKLDGQVARADRIKALIVQGRDPDDPGRYASRSEAYWAVICAMVRASCTDEQMMGVSLDPDFKCPTKVLE